MFYKKNCISSLARLLDTVSQFALFSGVRFQRWTVDKKANLHENWNMQSLFWRCKRPREVENLARGFNFPRPYQIETCKLYSGVLWVFVPNFVKIDPYNFELYRVKICAFLRHSVERSWDTVYELGAELTILWDLWPTKPWWVCLIYL